MKTIKELRSTFIWTDPMNAESGWWDGYSRALYDVEVLIKEHWDMWMEVGVIGATPENIFKMLLGEVER